MMAALADSIETIAGRNHPGIRRRTLQIFAEIFEHGGRLGRYRCEIVEGLVSAGSKACRSYVMTENPPVHDLCKEAGARYQLAHHMWDVLLPLLHERFLIASSATEGDNYNFSPGR